MRPILAALVLLAILQPSRLAGDENERRTEIGANLFRTLLAADVELQRKKGADDRLLIVVFYASDSRRAGGLAKSLSVAEVHGIGIVAEAMNDASFAKLGQRAPAAIFIADLLPRPALQSLIRYGIEHHIIVYSPFDGDVESGVLGGLSIQAQVRPFLNQNTLDASHISLSTLFLKVSKVYR